MISLLAALVMVLLVQSVLLQCGKKSTNKKDKMAFRPKEEPKASQIKKESKKEVKNEKSVQKPVQKETKEQKKERMVKKAIEKGLLAPQDDNNTIEEFKSNWGVMQENHISTAPPVAEPMLQLIINAPSAPAGP